MPFGLLSISASFATIPVVQNLFQMALVYSFAAAVYQAVRRRVHPAARFHAAHATRRSASPPTRSLRSSMASARGLT
jgi:hypothetical protein